jgi:DNA-directed RNA polymerase subunit RPC12/RpoP
MEEVEKRKALKNQKCPQCKEWFKLVWNDYSTDEGKQSLIMRGCPSGGIYDVYIKCPNCSYEEEL